MLLSYMLVDFLFLLVSDELGYLKEKEERRHDDDDDDLSEVHDFVGLGMDEDGSGQSNGRPVIAVRVV